jgi:SanA protein
MKIDKRRFWRIFKWTAVIGIVFIVISCIGARWYIHSNANGRVYSDISQIPSSRVAMVLGAKVTPDGKLSTLLRDRVDAAVALYKAGKASKLLMSGDNRFAHYNEPERMKEYAVAHGVPAGNVLCDYAGRRTYDSVYRAKNIFGIDKMIIISQEFHLDRAIFLSDHIGVDATGLSADLQGHFNLRATTREMPACLACLLDIYVITPHPVMGKREQI